MKKRTRTPHGEYEPLIYTWPQGGGGAEPSHTASEGRETMRYQNAYRGSSDQRPVTHRRLALHTTTGTTPPTTGAELCAPVPSWKE